MIFGLSSIPGTIKPEDEDYYQVFVWLPPDIQNLLHIPVYAVLAWLWWRALEARLDRRRNAAATALLITVAYGFLDEWHQSFVPGRYGSFTDIALDCAGALLGVAVGSWLQGRRQSSTISG